MHIMKIFQLMLPQDSQLSNLFCDYLTYSVILVTAFTDNCTVYQIFHAPFLSVFVNFFTLD